MEFRWENNIGSILYGSPPLYGQQARFKFCLIWESDWLRFVLLQQISFSQSTDCIISKKIGNIGIEPPDRISKIVRTGTVELRHQRPLESRDFNGQYKLTFVY